MAKLPINLPFGNPLSARSRQYSGVDGISSRAERMGAHVADTYRLARSSSGGSCGRRVLFTGGNPANESAANILGNA